MTTSLIDSMGQVARPDLAARIASELNEPEQNVTRGLQGGTTSLLAGLVSKSGDSGAMQQLFGIITNSANDGRVLDNPASLVGAASSPISALGGDFLSSIFGNRASAVHDVLAKSSGLKVASIAKLMQIASPLVLGVLGKRVRDGGLNAGSFTRLLTSERDGIQRAAPAGLSSALGTEQRAAAPADTAVRRDVPVRDVPIRDVPHREVPLVERNVNVYSARDRVPEPSSGRSWLWPTVATFAALGLLWAVWPRGHRTETVIPDTTRSGTAGGEIGTPVAPMTPPVGAPVASPGMITVSLPNGTSFQVPSSTAEARLSAFLNDPSRQVDDTSYFQLDQLQYQGNSAKLSPESNAELKNIAQILQAYPNASAKVVGFSDSAGNRHIAVARASSARAALIGMGVASSRLTAEGFRSGHPTADSSMEAVASQNRGVAILITRK